MAFKNTFNILIIVLFSILTSCENNIETIKKLTASKLVPTVSAKNIQINYSDSGLTKFNMKAPILERFSMVDKPYIEFTKGIDITIFDTLQCVESKISAKYAIYYEKEKLWIARNNVVAKNLKKNEELDTEEMYWDQEKKIIYSNKFTKIVNPDGVFYGQQGFEANESVTRWHLKGISGTVNVNDQFNGKNP